MNILTFSGHLGRDPETRYTADGKAVCTLAVPCTVGYGDKQVTTWVQCTAWEKKAEACGQYLRKGSLVTISGRFWNETYQKDGVDRTVAKLTIVDIVFPPKSEAPAAAPANQQRPATQQTRQPPAQQQRTAAKQTAQTTASDFGDDPDDDIPF